MRNKNSLESLRIEFEFERFLVRKLEKYIRVFIEFRLLKKELKKGVNNIYLRKSSFCIFNYNNYC